MLMCRFAINAGTNRDLIVANSLKLNMALNLDGIKVVVAFIVMNMVVNVLMV